jgi:hypothetical protein
MYYELVIVVSEHVDIMPSEDGHNQPKHIR